MKKARHILFCAAILLPHIVLGQTVPDTLSFQGYLTSIGGTPTNTTTSMVFKLYKDGTAVWTETHPSVTVTEGHFNVLLGSITPMDTVAFDRPIELGVKVGGDPEITPRTPLTAASFALGVRGMSAVWVDDGFSQAYNIKGGFEGNTVDGDIVGGTIAGGGGYVSGLAYPNSVTGHWGTIGGGMNNSVTSSWGTVAGGQSNLAGDLYTTVGGGTGNLATQQYATIGGGNANRASGLNATVPGGLSNQARANYSFAGGYYSRVRSLDSGSFVWNDSATSDSLVTTGANQFLIGAAGGVGIGTNSPLGELHISSGINGDANVYIESDTEGSNNYNNPMIHMRQDGGDTGVNIGFDEDAFGFNVFGIGRRSSGTDYGNAFLMAAASGAVGIGIPWTGLTNQLHVAESVNGDGNFTTSYVTWVENTSTGTSADVLALSVGASSPGSAANFVGFFADGTLIGQIEGGGSSVVYNTTGADYAELLPRREGLADVEPGSVVGVRGGQLYLETEGAQRVMVVTDRPAVLGNRPPGEEMPEHLEPIAFVGQVPAYIRGAVEVGDYIVPSGRDDGVARAVSPEELRVSDLDVVIGVAWEASSDPGLKKVIIEVGLDRAAAAAHAFQSKIETLEERIAALEKRMGS